MALYDLEQYLFRLKNDPAMQAEFQAAPERHLAAQPLDDASRAALLNKDIAALWELGVHPMLMAPMSRFFGLTAAEYLERLRPFARQRTFRS